jgi:integrase
MAQTPRTVNYKLTDKRIQALKPKAKPYPVADGGGLFIDVLPSGATIWRYSYGFEGKRTKATIGSYPAIGIKAARDQHETLRAQVVNGIDPARQKRIDKIEAVAAASKALTFQDFAQTWVDEQQTTTTARTKKQVLAWLTNDIIPAIGQLQLGQVHAADVRDLLETMRNTPTKAAHVQSILDRIFKYAALKLILTSNPAQAMKGLITKPHAIHYTPLTVAQIGPFIQAVRTCSAHAGTRLAVELLMLTAIRKDNVSKARWAHIDLEAKTWVIPGRTVGGNGFMKMPQPHTVYLSTQAVAILRQARQLSASSEFVFPAVNSLKKPIAEVAINHLFARLKSYGECPADFAPHGLRSTFSTLANEGGLQADVIEICLAHTEKNAVRAAYNRAQYSTQCKEAWQWYADRLDQIVKGADVIQLRAA